MRFFKDEEFLCGCQRPECPAPKAPHRLLGLYLDRMREMYGAPIVITSGNRCPEHNRAEGGEEKSEHVWPDGCLGVDVRCSGSRERGRLLDAARHAGISRIGIYSAHLHVGIGDTILAGQWPPTVTWVSPKA